VSPQHELRLWRESTTIFMTSGHGGCGPHGMALAALSRGFGVTLWLNRSDVLFTDGLRNPEKQAVVALVQHDFEDQLAALGIVSQEGELSIDALGVLLSSRQIPVMLISSWSLAREKAPHWIVVAGVDDEFVYIHDPDADGDDTENTLDRQYIPIDHLTFKRMTRFGKVGLRAAVVLRKDA